MLRGHLIRLVPEVAYMRSNWFWSSLEMCRCNWDTYCIHKAGIYFYIEWIALTESCLSFSAGQQAFLLATPLKNTRESVPVFA